MSKKIQNSKLPATKLTDTQMKILHAASLREDCCLTPIPLAQGAQAVKIGEKLIAAGLVREMKAKGSMPVWRRDGATGTAFVLRLTAAGAKAILAEGEPSSEETTATEKGQTPAPAPTQSSAAPMNSSQEANAPAVVERRQRGEPRPTSKIAVVVGMLSQPGGATLGDLIAATGWLPHTTRAALTGLRKRGYVVTLGQSVRHGGSTYSITSKSADGERAVTDRAAETD